MKPLARLIVAVVFSFIPAVLQAAPITIINAGFETPPLGEEGFTSNVISGWVGTDLGAANNFGVYNPSSSSFPAEAPEGSNVAFIERGAIFQILTAVLEAGSYSLSVMVGDSLVDPVSPFTIELRAGANIIAQASAPIPADGTFALVSASYVALSGDSLLGQQLEIRLVDNDFDKLTEPYFDDVRLDFIAAPQAVPEPTSLILLGSGLLGTIARARRRRR